MGALSWAPNVAGSIPSQGTYLGCGFSPGLWHIWEATDQCFSLTWMSLSLPLPLSKINTRILR